MDTQTQNEQPILSWKAPQVVHHEHGVRWYLMASLILGLCVAYSIWTAAWSFLIVLVILTVIYLYAHRIPPTEHSMEIFQKGFSFDGKFFPWERCHGFWIEERMQPHTLTFELKQFLYPHIKIHLGDLDVETVHNTLGTLTSELAHRKQNLLDIFIYISKL